jgi:hypothetical protein
MNNNFLDGCKNLFIVFPAGAGGNHLANLISTLPQFRSVNDSDAISRLSELYTDFFFKGNGINVHFSRLQNLQPDILIDNKDRLLSNHNINVFCAHARELSHTFNNGAMDQFTDRRFILISHPIYNTIALSRMKNGPWSMGDPSKPEEYEIDSFFKKVSNSPKSGLFDKNQILTIDGDVFFTNDGMDHIIERLSPHLGEFPNACRMMHEFWYGGIILKGTKNLSKS